jgi:hypothetical protein
MKAEEFAARISQVTRTRRHDEWQGECPNCHRLSLRFSDGTNGLLVGCTWAMSDLGRHGVMIDGCDSRTIAAALGWTVLDFLNPDLRTRVDIGTGDIVRRRRRKSSGRRVWFTNSHGSDAEEP